MDQTQGLAHTVAADDALSEQPIPGQGEGRAGKAGHKGRVLQHFIGAVEEAHHLLQIHFHLPELGLAGGHSGPLAGPVHLHSAEHRLGHVGLVSTHPTHGVGGAGAGIAIQPVEQRALLDGALHDHAGEIGLEGKATVGTAALVGAQNSVVHLLEPFVLHVILPEVVDGPQLLPHRGKGFVLFLAVVGELTVEGAIIGRLGIVPAGLGQLLQPGNLSVDSLHLVRNCAGLRDLAVGH